MCKLLIIPKIKNQKSVKAFMQAIAKPLTRYDQDGLGYVALQNNRTLYGERWLNPKDAFKIRASKNKIKDSKISKAFSEIQFAMESNIDEDVYESHGMNTHQWASVMMHARAATCEKGLDNTHPFFSENNEIALIHNGVVSNTPKAWDQVQSTCDSETLLNGYEQLDCVNDIRNIQGIADHVDGYFALGVFAKQGERWILDVIKDSQAQLCAIYVHELESIIFCTSESVVLEALKVLKWAKPSKAQKLKNNIVLRFDALTGSVLGFFEFKESIPVVESYESKLSAWRDDDLFSEYSSKYTDYETLEDRQEIALNRFMKKAWEEE